MGALVDVILAPFVPLIVPWIRKLAEAVPAAAENAREFQEWLVNTAWPYVVGIWQKLPEWLRDGISKPLQYLIGTYLVLKFTGLLNIVTSLLFMGFGAANKTLAAILWVVSTQLKIAKAGAVFAKAAGAGSMGAILAGISLSLLTLVGVVVAIGVALGFVWRWLKKKDDPGNMGRRTRFLPNDEPLVARLMPDWLKEWALEGPTDEQTKSWWEQLLGFILLGLKPVIPGLTEISPEIPNLGVDNGAVQASLINDTGSSNGPIVTGGSGNVLPGPREAIITVNNNTDASVTVDETKRQERPTGGGSYYFDHIRGVWVEFGAAHLGTNNVRLL